MSPTIVTEDVAQECECRRRSQFEFIGDLAKILFEVYHASGPVDLLAGVTHLLKAQLHLAILTQPFHIPMIMTRLGETLLADYELRDDVRQLETSIRYYKKALAYPTGCFSSHCCETKCGLAYALYHRFKLMGSESDYKTALSSLDEARIPTSQRCRDSHGYPWVFIITGLIRGPSSGRRVVPASTDALQDILMSIKRTQEGNLPLYRSVVSLEAEARVCWALTEMTHDQIYLRAGLLAGARAMRMCSKDAEVLRHRLLDAVYNLHSLAQNFHWDSVGDRGHLKAAWHLAHNMQASNLCKRNNFVRWNALYLWARAALEHAVQYEDLATMERAVDALRKTLTICPPTHIGQKNVVASLSYALGLYFYQSGRISALDQWIALQDLGLEYISRSPSLASNIAEGMLVRAQISDTTTARLLIDQAVHLCQSRQNAEGFATSDTREKAALDLQIINASRIQRQINAIPCLDVETTLELARRDIEMSHDPSDRIGLVLAQSDALIANALNNSDVAFISQAEALLEQELSTEYMATSIYCVDLLAAKADVLVAKSSLQPQEDHDLLSIAWKLYKRAATYSTTSGRIRERFQACLRWGSYASTQGHAQHAFEAYSCAVEMLPRVILLSEDIIGRIEALRQLSGLVASSVASALDLDDISAALEFLEKTRGIIWGQSFQTRASQLEYLPADVRERFFGASQELEQSDNLFWTVRRQAAEKLEQVVCDIRHIPTFERFLLPPLLPDIVDGLRYKNGYAIVISANSCSCDVIMLGLPQGYCHLRLPKLNTARITYLSQRYVASCSTYRASQKEAARGFVKIAPDDSTKDGLLPELWLSLIRPIFEAMCLLGDSHPKDRKRLWWCPTGVLSSLPLHAAGIYNCPAPEYVGMYAVSSYTPTLSALHHMLTENPSATSTCPKMLLLAQRDAAGLPSLPNTELEIDCVARLLPKEHLIPVLNANSVTVDTALAMVKHASILHLACHGHQDQSNPINSGFDLQDGRLTMGRLMQLQMDHPQLAYLSACESAGVDESRPDECLNLAGTMIFAGFRSVIATLGVMNDVDGPFIAERIYKHMFQAGYLDMSEVAYAVDHAVQELRETGVSASRWATYVHFGI